MVAMTPQRIQRKRTKGWKMPEGAIYVGRPTRWGNPFTVVNGWKQGFLIYDDSPDSRGGGYIASFPTREKANAAAVKMFKKRLGKQRLHERLQLLMALRGHDLVCWCPLDQPCHADVLLEIANKPL